MSQDNKKSMSEVFRETDAYKTEDGKLEFVNRQSGERLLIDFDNQTLPKTEQTILKIKNKKEDTDMTEEEKKDLTEDSKKMIDGKEVDTPAEGDDDDVEDKIKGSPYNDEEKFSKKKDTITEDAIRKEVETLKAELEGLKSVKTDLESLKTFKNDLAEERKIREAGERKDLIETLQQEPYKLPLDSIKDLSLTELKSNKASYDKLPMIQDFFNQSISYDDIKKGFDMEPQHIDARDMVLKNAQAKFKNDIGEERWKKDFGGAFN